MSESSRRMLIRRDGRFAIVTIDNPPVNALSHAVRQGLWDAVAALDADASIDAVLLVCAGRTFIAGADVNEFGKPPVAPHLRDVVARIEMAETPWIAVIHGTALGGGFEVAMGCRFRIASTNAKIGLPEVTLGIIPGAGGTVRTPRLAGVEAALDLVTSGKPISASTALKLGLIDAVADGDLVQAALNFAESVLDRALPLPSRARSVVVPSTFDWAQAEAAVRKAARGEEAPLGAFASIRKAAELDFDVAMAFEREIFLTLRSSPQAAALRAVFFAERAAPRPPDLSDVPARKVTRVGVVDGGPLGAEIAAALSDSRLHVVLVERDQAALEHTLSHLRVIIGAAAERGQIPAAMAAEGIKGVQGQIGYACLADVDLVIEAGRENLEVKRGVLAALGTVCRPDTILATNTSSLDLRMVAAGLPYPERFLGLHFVPPVHGTKLVEIVPLPETTSDVVSAAFALARSMNKIPVRAGLCDGFIGERLLKVMRVQAERVLLRGGTIAAIDSAMSAFGFTMGPFEAEDVEGLDIAAFQRQMARARGEMPFAPVADRLCALSRYGLKTHGGWYDYAEGESEPKFSPITAACIAEAASEAGFTQRDVTSTEITDAILLPMINEGAKILGDGIARRAVDIDLVGIHGYGFPRRSGGPMHWAEARGLHSIVTDLQSMARSGLTEAPCALLVRAAAEGGFKALGY